MWYELIFTKTSHEGHIPELGPTKSIRLVHWYASHVLWHTTPNRPFVNWILEILCNEVLLEIERVPLSQSLLQWRHNERDGVSNHRRLDRLPTVCSGEDQRKHQSSASLAFRGIHRWPVVSRHKRSVTRIKFPFDDAIMGPKRCYEYAEIDDKHMHSRKI